MQEVSYYRPPSSGSWRCATSTVCGHNECRERRSLRNGLGATRLDARQRAGRPSLNQTFEYQLCGLSAPESPTTRVVRAVEQIETTISNARNDSVAKQDVLRSRGGFEAADCRCRTHCLGSTGCSGGSRCVMNAGGNRLDGSSTTLWTFVGNERITRDVAKTAAERVLELRTMDFMSTPPKSRLAAVFQLAGYFITFRKLHNGDALSHSICA